MKRSDVRRVVGQPPPSLHTLNQGMPAGVLVQKNSLGGLSIIYRGATVGWLHENGERWNAYRSLGGATGEPLGCYPQEEAIHKVLYSAGWPGPTG
jgi:hypothetical protein